MIITVASQHGAGKSSAVNGLLEIFPELHKLDISRKFREIAEARGSNADDFSGFLAENIEEANKVDREIDDYQKKEIGKGNVVVDSNLGAMLAPDALNVLLVCKLEIRAERVFSGGKRYGDKEVNSVEEMQEQLSERDENDRQRYLKLYDFDMFDKKHYDLIVDTSETSKKDVVQKIVEELKRRNVNVV